MHDFKNILLAWVSAAPTFVAALDGGSIVTIMSAIILPTIFFALGKAVDVCVQIYFRRGSIHGRPENDLPPRPRSAAAPPIQEGSLGGRRNRRDAETLRKSIKK